MMRLQPGSRRWWLAVAGYVVGLFSVQPFLGFWVDAFKARWGDAALDRAVMVAAVAVGAVVAVAGVRALRWANAGGRWLFAVALVFYALGIATLEVPQERLHYAEYGLLAALIYVGLQSRGDARRALALAAASAATIGLLDEILQGWLWERRYFDWRDVELNARAALLGVILASSLTAPASDDPEQAG